MKNRELIKELLNFKLDAEVHVTVHNKDHSFSICGGGGGDGQPLYESPEISFYVDELCNDEQGGHE